MAWFLGSLKKARNSLTETVRKLSNSELTAEELRKELEFSQAPSIGLGSFVEGAGVLEDWTKKLQADDDRYEEEGSDRFNLCTFREVFFSCGALETAVVSIYTNRRECFDFHSSPNFEFTQKLRELLHLCFVEFIADWEPLLGAFFRSSEDLPECLGLLVRLFIPGRAVIHCADVASLVQREIDELLPLLPPAVGDFEIQSLALKKHAELCAALVEVSERLQAAQVALREHRKSVVAEFRAALAEWTKNAKLEGERSRERVAEIEASLSVLRSQSQTEIDQLAKNLEIADGNMEALKQQAAEVKEAMGAIETDIAKQAERKSEAKRKLVSTYEAQNEAESERNLRGERTKNLISKYLQQKEVRQAELVTIGNFQDLLRTQVPSRIPRAREIACEAISDFYAQALVLLGADGLGKTATAAETSEIVRALEEFSAFEEVDSVNAPAGRVRELLTTQSFAS